MEFDSNWNTSSCGDGNINVKVCSRATDDPNWSNATCSDRNYYLAPKQVVVPAPTAELWVDSDNITTGSCTYLHWNSTNANSAEIDGESVNLSGDFQVCPPVTKKYSLAVHGNGGDASRNLTVVVSGSPQSPNTADYFSTKDLIDINGNLYVIVNGEKRHIPNPETFDALGLSRDRIDNKGFNASELDKIPTGKDIPDVARDKAGFDAFKAKYFANLSPIVPNQGSTIIEPPTTGGQVQAIPNGPQGLASDGECPASPTVLTVGGQAEIADRDLNLRPRPNVNTKELTVIPNFAQVKVVDGPRCKQEVRWYMVEYKDVQGWAAEVGTGGEYHMYPVVAIEPVATEVPQTEIPLVVIVPTVPEPATSGVSPLVDTGCDELATGQWWNPFNPPDVSAAVQCTIYVASVKKEIVKCWGNTGPNAGLWDDKAKEYADKCGWSVTNDFSKAQSGDVVVWNGYDQNNGKSCAEAFDIGHVALYEASNADGTIQVNGSNWSGDESKTRVDPNCMSIIHTPAIAADTVAPSDQSQTETPAPAPQVDKCSQYTWPKSWFCKWGWIK